MIANEQNRKSRCRKRGTYESSVRGLLSSLSFPTSVLVHFIGELEGRRFGLGPLGGCLPSLVRGVRARLNRFLGGHDMKIRMEVVAGEVDDRK